MDLRGDWEYIQKVSSARLASNKTPHHVYTHGDGIEVLGAAGELCARRFLGLDEELHTGFDGGADLEFCGKRVDVKTTMLTPKISHRFMQWPIGKKVKSDIVLMAAIDPISKSGTVIGYAFKEEIEIAPVNLFRPQPCRELVISSLHPAYTLFEWKMADQCKMEW